MKHHVVSQDFEQSQQIIITSQNVNLAHVGYIFFLTLCISYLKLGANSTSVWQCSRTSLLWTSLHSRTVNVLGASTPIASIVACLVEVPLVLETRWMDTGTLPMHLQGNLIDTALLPLRLPIVVTNSLSSVLPGLIWLFNWRLAKF